MPKKSGKRPYVPDDIEYWRDKMTPVGARRTRPALAEPIPPKFSFAPDRCIFVNFEASKSSLIALKQFEGQKETKLSTEWQASSKATPNTGFLDLPKEIRDMVYAEICGCLKRRGLQWGATAPRESTQPAEDAYSPRVIKCPRGRRNHDGEQEEPADPPLMFADCAIMRTCRQLHAEFATVLYATPLQVSTTLVGKYNMPVSSTYAHLVREVLHASSSLHLGKNSAAWRNHLQMATGLSKIFPQASSIRLAFYMSDSHEDPAYAAKRWPERWEQNVADVRGAVKAVKKLSNVSIVVPYNLEMVQLQRTRKGGGEDWLDHYDEVQSLFTPVTEAVAEMRAKKPKGVKSGRIL